MKERVLTAIGAIMLAGSVTLVILQGSFTFGEFAPTSVEQTYLFWAISTLIFLLMVTLGFMLFRTGVRLYIEHQANRTSTGLKTKMVVGALLLSFVPAFFMVLFSVWVLNRNLDKWFSRPAENIQLNLWQLNVSMTEETQAKADAQARWLAALPEVERILAGGVRSEVLDEICESASLGRVQLVRAEGTVRTVCPEPAAKPIETVTAQVPLHGPDGSDWTLTLESGMPMDLAATHQEIARSVAEYEELRKSMRATRTTYLLLLAVITLFILFVATWIALFLAKQVNVPIAALLKAASRVRGGDLSYRVRVEAIDELASLVRSFNEMTEALDRNASELESRRRFIEAILENVPTGVVSITAEGRLRTVNRALSTIFTDERVREAERLSDLFPEEEADELRYLLNRARRTGVATRQFESQQGNRQWQLAVTVSALVDRTDPGFVVVIEDTTELLRAQKAIAWREVARRIAHEMKNPLTPISLSAERIGRQVDKASAGTGDWPPEVVRILKECSSTISQEVESVRTLVDEFSHLARFPSARLEPGQINDVIESALSVFADRLDGVSLTKDLAPNLPPVMIDREQFKRVIVNLVDNSAEAMEASLTRRLYVGTRPVGPEAVEMVVADTGCGVSMEDRERLFQPDFSTKRRGTGLGLAIVNQILTDHGAHIRVEENRPTGTRFVIEIPAVPGGPAPEAAVARTIEGDQ